MNTTEMLDSKITDSGDVPLGEELELTLEDKARIMKDAGVWDTGNTPVSAFNSSI